MHPSTDLSVLLRRASAFPPTHLVVVNTDASMQDPIDEMAAFQPSFGVTVMHVYQGDLAAPALGEVNEAQLIRMLPDLASFDLEDPYVWATATYRYYRPGVMHALRTAFKDWSDARGTERTVLVFVGSPRTPLDAVLLGELPLDAAALFHRRSGALPLVLRLFVAPRRPFGLDDDLPIAHLLADLEQTYFHLQDYPPQSGRYEAPGAPCANPFDTSVWVEQAAEVVPLLRDVLRLHGEENAALAAGPASGGDAGVVPSLEAAMRADADRRRLDWLALCSTGHAPRLWTAGLPALMALLDMRHERRRAREPFASVGRYERERGWDDNVTVRDYLRRLELPRAAHEDLARADFPYRITEDDRLSKLEMARHLSDAGEFARAAELAEDLLEEDPDHRLLNRLLGADLFLSGNRRRGLEILRRCVALTEADPTLGEAQRADEIATLHHLMRDFDAAVSGYERAVEADPGNVHAYQGLVMIHRGRGEHSLADHWLAAAERRGLTLPAMPDAGGLDEPVERPAEAAPAAAPERRPRWWGFFKSSQ